MLDEYRIEPMTVGQYLDAVDNEDIKVDQAVQRDFCWTKEMTDALIYSALSRKIYIPNFILAEEKKSNGTKQTYVVDAGQRTEALFRFEFGNHRIGTNLRNYMISYNKKKTDNNGYVRDEYGNVESEIAEFDIRKKTYDDFPKELQDRFNGCPLTMAIYQDCTPEETAELVLLYNNHIGMNVSQKALTFVGRYAEEIKRIKDSNKFLLNCTILNENEKRKGIWERVISECVMIVNHISRWKKAPKVMCDYLNKNSSLEEYKTIESYFNRLIPYSDKLKNRAVAALFSSKNLFIWIKIFSIFVKLNLPDKSFGEFLNSFVCGLQYTEIDGYTWDSINNNRNTKDKCIINKKLNYLEKLMLNFLQINKDKTLAENESPVLTESEIKEVNEDSVEDFIRENIKADVTEEDIDDYYSMLDSYKEKKILSDNSAFLDWENEVSSLAFIAYFYIKEIDMDEWLKEFDNRSAIFTQNKSQRERYLHMKQDFENYLAEKRKTLSIS